jgi:NAD(P)-dependent dehydrogenase (short-subunit alcohol dehydrogenase family)
VPAESYSYELASQGIESVIVEPGAYETPVFGNTVTAADEPRTNTYGAVKEIPAKLNAALSSNAGNAQEVADAVLRIIETPAGEKQLRYLVSPEGFGVDQINALSKQVASQAAGSLRPRCRHQILQKSTSRLRLTTGIKPSEARQRCSLSSRGR